MREISDNKQFARSLSPIGKIKFWLRVCLGYRKADKKLTQAIATKECYYGPFKGEFGHFTAHTLPFVAYLHSKSVKIHYCGMELHRPLMIDESGNSIVHSFHSLRDFFAEVSPSSNKTRPPEDVQVEINSFKEKANKSNAPFFDIDDDFYYWFIHRNWLLKGLKTKAYKLDKVYGQKDREKAVCIFPRSKGSASSRNNGEPWNYPELISRIAQEVDKVYVCGHPSQVLAIEAKDNIELCITTDNAEILKRCSLSKLIITQHSGVNNLGEYTDTPVLLIYKGKGPIGSIQNTERFRPYIAGEGKAQLHPLSYAYEEAEVIKHVKKAVE